MDITDTINKIDRITTLIDKLETKRDEVRDTLLDWIYAERKEVLDYHNTGHYADQFQERDCDYHTLSASLGANCVILRSKAHYGDRDVEFMEIPLKHLLQPELVANLIAANKARKAAIAAEEAIVREQNEKKLLADLKAKYENKP